MSTTNEDWPIRRDAVWKTEDQDLLTNIAKNDAHWAVRKAAVEKISDITILNLIESNDSDEIVRGAARIRISELSHEEIKKEVSQSLPVDQGKNCTDSYIDDCFEVDTTVLGIDHREWRDIPEASSIPSLANSGKRTEAFAQARELQAKLPDFYFPYFWIGVLHEEEGDFRQARTILQEGYQSCQRKQEICDRLARTEFKEGNLGEAVKWWIRSMVIRQRTKSYQDPDPYLYLSYIAKAFDMNKVGAYLTARSEKIRNVGLDSATVSSLQSLVQNQGTQPIKSAIQLASDKFLVETVDETSTTDDADASFRADPHIKKMLSETYAWAGAGASMNLNAVFKENKKMFALVQDTRALVLIGREARNEWVRWGAVNQLSDQASLVSIARAELSKGTPSSDVLSSLFGKLTDLEYLQTLASEAPDSGVRKRAEKRLQELRESD